MSLYQKEECEKNGCLRTSKDPTPSPEGPQSNFYDIHPNSHFETSGDDFLGVGAKEVVTHSHDSLSFG